MHPRLHTAFSLDGRTAVVTGAARGIGRQAAVTFAQAGADVVLADVLAEELDETATAVTELGRSATVIPTDVSDKSSVDDLATAAVQRHGRIDVWANVAGILRSSMIVDTDEETLDAVIGVNLKGVYWGGAAAARVMQAQQPLGESLGSDINSGSRGSIINIASAGGDMPAPGISVYALTKSAVMMYTRSLATEMGSSGVRVNAVAPGFIDTPMVAVHYLEPDGSVNSERRDAIFAQRAAQAPMNRTGEPEDITWAMLYLATDASRFMTGQVLRPNGGVVMP